MTMDMKNLRQNEKHERSLNRGNSWTEVGERTISGTSPVH